MISNGSSNEGQMELQVPVGFTSWASLGADPRVQAIRSSSPARAGHQGSVFGGSAGYPRQQPPLGTQPAGQWIGLGD